MTEPWDDALMDGIALTEAFRRDDETTSRAVAAILRANGCVLTDTALCLAKLLAVICDEQQVDAVHFRRWGADAVRRD
jgi:hypothetical protein